MLPTDLQGQLAGLRAGDFSAPELLQASLQRADDWMDLNAWITRCDPQLLQAAAAEMREGALAGIPYAHKDLYCTAGLRTTCGSRMLEHFVPPYSATVHERIEAAGGLLLGKANLDEFAMGSSNTTSHFGHVINPWKREGHNTELVPGGSSGGSAASVAARIAMGATGTDTGGSIRQPAAFCGIAGIKPTYGRCSRWGVVAFASSLDQAGVFARTTEDCAILLESCAGFDPKDSTSAPHDVPDFRATLESGVKGLKIGIPKEYRVDGMPAEIEKLWENGIAWLKEAGAEIVDVSLPHTRHALPTYYIIASAEASSNLARYDGVRYGLREEGKDLIELYEKTRAAGFGDEVKRRIILGTYVLSAGYYDAYYIKAQKVRRLISNDFTNAFERCDALLTPTAPSAAFAIGENEDDPVKMYLNDVFTVPTSLAGLPGMSIPAGLNAEGLPLGLQIIGRPWDEETVFKVARSIEKAAAFTALPQSLVRQAA